MSKNESLREWNRSDTTANDTIVMNAASSRTHVAIESQIDAEKLDELAHEKFLQIERGIIREDEIANAFTDIQRYAHNNSLAILDRCNFGDFRELCLAKRK